MTQGNNIDEFDDFGNYIGPRQESRFRTHTSILGKIVIIVVAYFLITIVIDPMTTNVNESEIIYDVGSYPYNKVMDLFRDHPTDSDNDGLADKEESDGWDMESDVLSLMEGDISTFMFELEYPGDYLINASISTAGSTNLEWGWALRDHSVILEAEDWETFSLNTNFTPLAAGTHTLHLKVLSGNLSIDWIALVAPEIQYAEALDGVNTILTNGTITNMIVHVSTDPENPDSDYDGMLDGYEVATGVRIGGWQDPMVTNDRYALIIAGGSTDPADNYPSIQNDIEYVYEVLHDFYGYEKDKTWVLSWDGKINTLDIIDGPGTLAEIDSAFNEIEQVIGPNDFLFIYMVSHGLIGQFEVYGTDQKHDIFTYESLMDKIASIRENAGVSRVALVVEACHSGSCLFDVKGDNMVVIGSTQPEDDSYTYSSSYALFTYYFFEALEHPNLASLPSYEKVKNVEFTFEEHKFISLGEAFTIAKDKLKVQSISKEEQVPILDQDGDSISDEKEEGLAYVTYI